MNNELIKTDKLELLPDEVRKFIDPQGNGTDQEHQFFLELCKARNLNPFVKDVYFIKYGNMQAATVIAVDTFVARSMDHSIYEGYEAGWIVGPEDSPKRTPNPFGYLMGAWCKVMRTGMVPCEAVVRFDAFTTEKNRWKTDPFGMIQKCAIAAAHRKAFPKTFAHLYSQEEINNPNEKDEKKKSRKSKEKKGLEGLQDKIDESQNEKTNKVEITLDDKPEIKATDFLDDDPTEEEVRHELSSNFLADEIGKLNDIIGIDLTTASENEIKEKIEYETLNNDENYSKWVESVNQQVDDWKNNMTDDDYETIKDYCIEIKKTFKQQENEYA